MSKLTVEQQVVLAFFFDAHDAAAMRCMERWIWADEIRNNPDLAVRFVADHADGYRGSEMLRAWLAPIGTAVRQ